MATLKAAIDVLSGKADSLAKTKALALLPKPSAGAFVVAAAADIKLPADPNSPLAAVVKNLGAVGVQAGEAEGTMFLHASGLADAAESAVKIRQFVQGLIAFGQMMLMDRQDLPQLGEKVTVGGTENVVQVDAAVPTESLIAIVKHIVEQRKKMAAQKQAASKAAGTE